MRVLSLAKKPGTSCGGKVNLIGGALSEDHPARKAGIDRDGINFESIEDLNDDEVTMDPTGTNVYQLDDLRNMLNYQHGRGKRINHENREMRPTWPTKREMSLEDYRRFGGPEPAVYVPPRDDDPDDEIQRLAQGLFHAETDDEDDDDDPNMQAALEFAEILREEGIPENEWDNWADYIMPQFGIDTPDDLRMFFAGRQEIRDEEEDEDEPDVVDLTQPDVVDLTDEVHNVLDAYTNRMDRAVENGNRQELDRIMEYAADTLDNDMAEVAQDHHRDYLQRYYDESLNRLNERRRRSRERVVGDDGPPRRRQRGGAIGDEDPFEEPSQTFGLQTGAAYLPPEIVRHIGSFRPEGERVLFPLEERGQMRGVQAGAAYLPPEIVRHIGSFRTEGEDDFFDTSTEGTRTRSGAEISSAAENRSYIMHRLLSLDDDFFEDEEERAPNYNRTLRTIIRKAGEIRSKPHFDRRYWQDRLRRTGGTEMPAKMPGPREYMAFGSVL